MMYVRCIDTTGVPALVGQGAMRAVPDFDSAFLRVSTAEGAPIGSYLAHRFQPCEAPPATTPAPAHDAAAVAPAEGLAGTLATRHGRYGSFAVNGQIAQDIKAVMRNAPKWCALSGAQQEALDMFASKISRILTGDPNYLDNWHDVAGYAARIEELLKEQA